MGIRPAPILVQFIEKPDGSWLLLSPESTSIEVMSSTEAAGFIRDLKSDSGVTWGYSHIPEGKDVTWYIGGTTTEWSGVPLAVVLVIEEKNVGLAEDVGEMVLSTAMSP